MPRRCNESPLDEEPPKKRSYFDLKHGEFLTDLTGKQWKLGRPVGVGGFGEIYLAHEQSNNKSFFNPRQYVAKVESHQNGPLFVEINCYLRIAKEEMINNWKVEKGIKFLGMPHYVASGSHFHRNERYRFLILPKFNKDLEKVLQEKKILNIKTVLTISNQIINVLEYIHSKGYIHSDVKASNILLSNNKSVDDEKRRPRNLRPIPFKSRKYIDDSVNDSILNSSNGNQIYLLDYGLACKYVQSNGEHKPFCIDVRKAHAGTVLFCSLDAHNGVQSRRSDLESLGYNMIYWLTGTLPWQDDIDNPDTVHKQKQRAMYNLENFLATCFKGEYPRFLYDYFQYLQVLQFQDEPDYNYCKKLFKQNLKLCGYKDDSFFDFENLEKNNPRLNMVRLYAKEHKRAQNILRPFLQRAHNILKPFLQSNIPEKPLLRKNGKNEKKKQKTDWFRNLVDPEEILRQRRQNEKKSSANFDSNLASIIEMDINTLNPTYAMIEVYNRCKERSDASPNCKGDGYMVNIDGYTPAMMQVLKNLKRKERTVLAKPRRGRPPKKHGKNSPKQPITRTKSASVSKKEIHQIGKLKSVSLRRINSLRG